MTNDSIGSTGHSDASSVPPLATGALASLVGLKLLLHVVTGLFSPYGFHRDERCDAMLGESCHGILLVGGTLDVGPNGMGRGK